LQKVAAPILKADDYLMDEFDNSTKLGEGTVVTIRKVVVRDT